MDEKTDKVPGFIRAWRTWRIVWAVLRNLLVLFAAMAAYSHASSHLETITLSVLILILQGVGFGSAQIARASFEEGIAVRRLILGLYEKAGDDITETLEILSDREQDYARASHISGSTSLVGFWSTSLSFNEFFTAL